MSGNDVDAGITGQEWSFFIESNDIGSKGKSIEIEAPDDVIAALCSRLNLRAINGLKVSFELQRSGVSKVIHINGRVRADLFQKCIITTEPVHEVIDETFDAWFADPNSAVSFAEAKRERMSRKDRDEQPIMEEAESPEEVIDGKIDLGELVVQNLSLSLNPYPKTEGAAYKLQDNSMEEAPEGTYNNPFAALKDWKAKEGKKDN